MDTVSSWLKGLKHKYNIQVEFIHCDNAGENKKLAEKCNADGLGTIFEYTATGTPQQNAYVERAFPMLMGRARAMMNFAGFTTDKKNNYGVRQVTQLQCLTIFWSINRLVHHHTLCSMGRMQSMPSIYEDLVKFV